MTHDCIKLLVLVFKGADRRLDKSHIDSLPFYFEKILIGKFQEMVNLVNFSIVEKKRELFLVSLVSNDLFARVKSCHLN